MRCLRSRVALRLIVLAAAAVVVALAGHSGRSERARAAGPASAARAPSAAQNGPVAVAPLSAPRARVAATPLPARQGIQTWGRGSWCWFGDPRAVRVPGISDQTIAGWVDWSGNITIGAYDPLFGVMRTHVVGRLFPDDHSAPAILVEPDKRLTVFFSGHDGPTIYYRTTLRPEDISAWGPVQQVPIQLKGRLGLTYPNPVLLPKERNLYLFWRGADWSADFTTRQADGRWGVARELIRSPGQRPYVKVDSNGSDEIALGFTDGHPRERVTSIFYAAYRGGSLWHASGRWIAGINDGPISPREADVVYDGRATGVSAWVWDVALQSGRYPVIVYATFRSTANHAYWYARWDGRRWVSHFMTFAGPSISPTTIEQQYSGGITLDHANPSVVYLSRQVGGQFEIEKWTTADGGYHWREFTVVRTPGADDIRPLLPRGSQGGQADLLWLRGHYGYYTDYRTSVTSFR